MNVEAGQCVANDKVEVPTETPVPVFRRSGRVQKQTKFYKLEKNIIQVIMRHLINT